MELYSAVTEKLLYYNRSHQLLLLKFNLMFTWPWEDDHFFEPEASFEQASQEER